MKKLILLDRDGVINTDAPNHVRSPEEWHPLSGSLEAISELKKNNYNVAIVTNQSGIGRGYFTKETLKAIHNKMRKALSKFNCEVDQFFYCPHHPDENCPCRKPKPGMILKALKHFNVQKEETIFIGDSLRDIKAAIAANCKPVLVLTGNGKETLKSYKNELTNVSIFEDLASFVKDFLSN